MSTTEYRPPAKRRLTSRQLQVLRALSRGLSYSEVAAELGISVTTAKHYMRFARWTLRARNTNQAIAEAARLGLIP